VKAARNDASLRSAEMHEIVSDVEGKMLQRESHFMSEVQAQNAHQQEVTQAHQENMRIQAIQQCEALEARQTQQQKMMQAQVTRQREEMRSSLAQQREEIQSQVENRFSELRDALLSRNETVAVETLPATQSKSVSPGMEHVHKRMNDGVNDGASERFDPRVDGSLCFTKVSTAPLVAETPSGADAAASEIGYNTYSTQPPPVAGMAPGAANAQ